MPGFVDGSRCAKWPARSVREFALYAALLSVYGLLNEDFAKLANPLVDTEGAALALAREPMRARAGRGLSNDF